jgi:tRNA A37 threonylcarbamoyladenosine modification protein TsaB
MLSVAIETSYGMNAVAVGLDEEVVFCREVRWDDAEFRDLGHLVESGLRAAGQTFLDVDRLGIDCGPGNRSSVRRGIAYANGLAFGLGLGIFSAGSLDIMAAEGGHAQDEPVLSLRVGSGRVFGGLFRGAQPARLCQGPLPAVVERLAAGLTVVTVAGDHRGDVASLLPAVAVNDSGIALPSVATLREMAVLGSAVSPSTGPGAVALTEASRLFESTGMEE